jgi:hypothetical protein
VCSRRAHHLSRVTRPVRAMESDWTLTRIDGRDDVALVTVELHNPSPVTRRVRVTNRLAGPLLPPRRAGVPESGWDEDGFTGVVPAGERIALGYACPAADAQPPVDVVDEGRAAAEETETTAAAVVRGLDAARPPVDALPDATRGEGNGSGACVPPSDDGSSASDGGPSAPAADATPQPVEAWLTATERRIGRGERLTDVSAESVATALDGEDVADLDTRIAADADALQAVSERAAALAERARAVDVPHAALRRLA